MKTYLIILAAALFSAQLASGSIVIVSHDFSGDGSGSLDGVTADTFAAGITTAGGSSTWSAREALFHDDGEISLVGDGQDGSAFLNMGSYINATKGTATGLFTLSATMNEPVTGSWFGVTFFLQNEPNTDVTFTNTDTSNLGMGTLIYRTNGNVDGFPGPGTDDGAAIATVSNVEGTQTLSMVLDLTPDGGWNGTNNFGTITFFLGSTNMGSFTHTTERDFGAIGLVAAGNNTQGSVSYFELAQIPEPSVPLLLGGAGALMLLRRRR